MSQMSTPEVEITTVPKRRPMSRMMLAFYALIWSALLCFGLLVAVMQDRTLPLPESLQARLQAELNARLNLPDFTFDRADIGLTELFNPKLIITGAQFSDPEISVGVQFGVLNVVFDGKALVFGRVAPNSVFLSDAVFDVTRKSDGSFDLGFVISGAGQTPKTLDEILHATEAFFERPEFASIELGQLDQLTVNYVDRLNGRAWTLDGGRASVKKVAGVLQLRGDLALLTGGGELATLGLFYNGTANGAGSLGAEFRDLPARDLALQSKGLTWLSFVDGNLSGSFRSARALGELGVINAILDFGNGSLTTGAGSPQLSYSEAKIYFSYLSNLGRMNITQASIQSDWGSLSAEGYALLVPDAENGKSSGGLVLHLDVENAVLSKTPWWRDPVAVSKATGQMKINYDPLKIDLGKFLAQINGAKVSLSGKASLEPSGWSFGMQGEAQEVHAQTAMTLWPEALKPKSRRWFNENVKKGNLKNLTVQARQAAGGPAILASSFQFDQAEVKFMRFMPVISDGIGYGTFEDDEFILSLQTGHVKAAEGGTIILDGSMMLVPSTKIPDPPATFILKGNGPIHAAMSLLDNKPFEIPTKAKRGVGDVTGQITFETEVQTRLKKSVKPEEVDFDLTGFLQNVRSKILVPGRVLSAKTMNLSVVPTELKISGAGSLSGVPFDGSWTQPLGSPGIASKVEAQLELTNKSLAALNIALPKGGLSGKTVGNLTLDIVKDTPVAFELTSNLEGASLQVPALKWSKNRTALGELKVSGAFTKPMTVDDFTFKAAGLSTAGRVDFGPEGLEQVVLKDLQIANWLSAEITLVNRGAGKPMRILVTDGSLDLRKFPQSTSQDAGDAGPSAPLAVNLRQLQISDSLALTNVAAEFSDGLSAGGLFSATVNGGTLISGRMSGHDDNLRLDLVSQDAGGALRDAGLLRQANGGLMTLLLTPHEGGWNGDLKISDVRIKDAPQVAQLLSAASIVGLLDQMDGKGIFFDTINGTFYLKNELFTIYESSAVGPSLGMSLDGYINTKRKELDLQGVLSPFYLLNGIGAFLTRRGEGLIGFNFTLGGAIDKPETAVNPLSLFTPGMFREIFRRNAPEQN